MKNSKKKIDKKKTVKKKIDKKQVVRKKVEDEPSMKKKDTKNIIEKPKIKQKVRIEKTKTKETGQEIIPIEEKIVETIIEEKSEPVAETIEEPPIKPIKTRKEKRTVLRDEGDFDDEKNKVEALLFAHGKYIDETLISELCGIDKRRIKKILEQLKQDYEQRDNALTIFQEGNSWKINVREKYLSIVRKIVADTELPKSVMETLAVIAWKSPIYQSEVVRIRGNKCYDHIEVLEEAGFILKDKKGRSYVLKTTDKFYNYFEIDHGNLKSIFEEVKIPVKEEQKTLEDDVKVPENLTINEKIEQIEVKRWTETDEEKEQHRQFLDMMEGKITDVQQKNTLLEEEFPSRKKEVTIVEQDILENVNKEDANTNGEQPAEDHKRSKSLTKKQLEKKFKDDILRVREKMEKK